MVETQSYCIPEEVVLEHGDRLAQVSVAYETYGRLNNEKSNAVFVCHALFDLLQCARRLQRHHQRLLLA
jgi:homoserine O-acetyltransferase